MNKNETSPKCYNSFSCIASILIILFVLGSIVWDICYTKPAMRESIDEIKTEIRDIKYQLKLNDPTTIDVVDVADSIEFDVLSPINE